MVKNFRVVTQAMKQKRGASPSAQLAHTSAALQRSSTSGSTQVYSQGLRKAANQLQGQPAVNSQNAMSLVQALLGGGEAAQPAEAQPADMLGQLLGGLVSGGATQTAQPAQAQPQDVCGRVDGRIPGR